MDLSAYARLVEKRLAGKRMTIDGAALYTMLPRRMCRGSGVFSAITS